MKVLIQHTQRSPGDWVELDSSAWGSVPKLAQPPDDRLQSDLGITAAEGHIYGFMVQGMEFGGADHYSVRSLADGACEVTEWNDDPVDYPEGEKCARIWTIRRLAPDARLHGAINTRIHKDYYAQPAKLARLQARGPYMNCTLHPWEAFTPPREADTRHGIWISNRLAAKHDAARAVHGWREWTEGLDPSELDVNGHVKTQADQGRRIPKQGTITYFLNATSAATGVHVALNERAQNETQGGAGSAPAIIPLSGDALSHVWTTPADSPNSADWPNGVYTCSMDVQTLMLVDSFGLLTRGGSAGHFARVNAGLTADQETWTQDEAAFTSTGISVATNTIDPSSGSADDRFEVLVAADNSDTMMDGTLTIRVGDADSFGEGPWTVGEAAVVQDPILGPGIIPFAR